MKTIRILLVVLFLFGIRAEAITFGAYGQPMYVASDDLTAVARWTEYGVAKSATYSTWVAIIVSTSTDSTGQRVFMRVKSSWNQNGATWPYIGVRVNGAVVTTGNTMDNSLIVLDSYRGQTVTVTVVSELGTHNTWSATVPLYHVSTPVIPTPILTPESAVSYSVNVGSANTPYTLQYYDKYDNVWRNIKSGTSVTNMLTGTIDLVALTAADPLFASNTDQFRVSYGSAGATSLITPTQTLTYDAASIDYNSHQTWAASTNIIETQLTDQQAVITPSGATSHVTGKATSSQTIVTTTGTSATELEAANQSIGVQRNILSSANLANLALGEIVDNTREIADAVTSDQSGSGGEGVDLAPLEESVDVIEEKVTTLDDNLRLLAKYLPGGESEASNLQSAKDMAFASALDGAASIRDALQSADLDGSGTIPTVNVGDGSSASVFILQLPIIGRVNCDPFQFPMVVSIASFSKTLMEWFLMIAFFQWWAKQMQEAIRTSVLVPPVVSNTNPLGIAGGAVATSKAIIWAGFLLTLPAIFVTLRDSAGFLGAGLGWASVMSGPVISTASSAVGAAWHIITQFFPITVIINLSIVYVTFPLFSTTYIYLSMWMYKHVTAY